MKRWLLVLAACGPSHARAKGSGIEDVDLVPTDGGVVAVDRVGGYQVEFPAAPALIEAHDRDRVIGVQVGDVAYFLEIERPEPGVPADYDREIDRMRSNGRYVETMSDTSMAGLPARALTARGAVGLGGTGVADMTGWIVTAPSGTTYLLDVGTWSGGHADGAAFRDSFQRTPP